MEVIAILPEFKVYGIIDIMYTVMTVKNYPPSLTKSTVCWTHYMLDFTQMLKRRNTIGLIPAEWR